MRHFSREQDVALPRWVAADGLGRRRDGPASASKRTIGNPAPDWLLRLGIGLAQGVALALLVLAHDQAIWPAGDPAFSTALLLAIIMAPLALLEGFDQIEPRLLLLWSGTLGFVIATLGLWQQERGGPTVIPVAAIALFVLLAHITVRAALREGRAWPGYGSWTKTAWTVMARLLVWGAITALAFVVLASCNRVLGWVLTELGVNLRNAATLISMPLLGLASTAGFTVAADGWLQRRARSVLPTCWAAAPPILGAAALALLGLDLVNDGFPHGMLLALAALLVIAVHAFDWSLVPKCWRKFSQGVVGFIILGSTLVASLNLHARVQAHGWTDMRIYAAMAAGVLALYGLACLADSFSVLRGTRAFRVMERASPLLVLLVAALCLMLSTPLFDPLALAVKSQVSRLQDGGNPAMFDFSWLQRQGGRFGQEALAQLESRLPRPSAASSPAPAAVTTLPAVQQIVRPVPLPVSAPRPLPQPIALSQQPPQPVAARPPRPPAAVTPQPAPGSDSDIVLHTAGEFPATLLAQDWPNASPAPPCLTEATSGCEAWLLDLDGDGRKEALLAYRDGARVRANVLKQGRGRWIVAAEAVSPPCPGLFAQVKREDGPQSGWHKALVAGLGQRAGAPPARLPCPRS